MSHVIVSIIIPVYNRAELIKETLESVIWQTDKNWECLLIDDNSTDNTWDVLETFAEKDDRIRIFKRGEKLKGANVCRNIGIEKTNGKYAIFLDSDDLLAPWCVESRIREIKNRSFDMMIFQVFEFDGSDIHNRRVRTLYGEKFPYDRFMDFEIPWGTAGVLWNIDFLRKIGGWYEPAQSWQDVIINMIALSQNAVQLWGNPLPDIFMRVTSGFDKISNTYDMERLINRCESLQYLRSRIEHEKFGSFERKYLADVINRIEYLPNEQIKLAIQRDFDFILKIRKFHFLNLYFKLYVSTRNKKLLHSVVYRLRGLFVIGRERLLIEKPVISDELFSILCEKFRIYPELKKKLHFENI